MEKSLIQRSNWFWLAATLMAQTGWGAYPVMARYLQTVSDLPSTRAERVSTIGDIELITLTPAIQQERGFERDHGALIYAIGERAARVTRLQAGDLIVQINRQRIDTAEEVTDILQAARRERSWIRVWVERSGGVYSTDFYP